MTTTIALTARDLADRYLAIIGQNATVAAVRDALAGDDRYEIVGELMDVASGDFAYPVGDPDADDALYDIAEDAATLVRIAIADMAR